MPAQTRVGKILGPYKKRTYRKPISPYTRGPNSVAKIRAAIGVENKYFDIEVASALPAATNFTSLTTFLYNPAIVTGDEVYQRNGRQILLKKVIFRGNLFTTPTTANTSVSPCQSCRLILWRNDQYAAPPGGYMGLADNSVATNSAIALGLFQSPNANGIGKAVDDQQFTIVPVAAANNAAATTVSTVAAEVPVMLSYKPKTPMKLNYQAAAVSNAPDKWFTILGVTDAATYLTSLNGVMRFYYTDA